MAEQVMNEKSLVEALREGDESSIDQLVDLYRDVIVQIAEHLCSDPSVAEEVAEEVLVRLCMEVGKNPDRSLESLVHEFAYDASLSRLLGSVDQHVEDAKAFKAEVVMDSSVEEEAFVSTTNSSYEPSLEDAKVHLEQAIDVMEQTARLLNEVD